jgi:hypothetical protein
MKRWGQWRHHRSIFALGDGQHQRNNDPLLLARIADPVRSPYLFLTCGQQKDYFGQIDDSLPSWTNANLVMNFMLFLEVTIGTTGMLSFRTIYEVGCRKLATKKAGLFGRIVSTPILSPLLNIPILPILWHNQLCTQSAQHS